jgi:hypothetical protein
MHLVFARRLLPLKKHEYYQEIMMVPKIVPLYLGFPFFHVNWTSDASQKKSDLNAYERNYRDSIFLIGKNRDRMLCYRLSGWSKQMPYWRKNSIE